MPKNEEYMYIVILVSNSLWTNLQIMIHDLKPVTLFSADQKTLSPMAEIFLLCGNVYLKRIVIPSCPHSICYKPEFWPEPGVSAVKVGVHLEVVLKVFLHLCLCYQLSMLDHNHTLKRKPSIFANNEGNVD